MYWHEHSDKQIFTFVPGNFDAAGFVRQNDDPDEDGFTVESMTELLNSLPENQRSRNGNGENQDV